jgi:hypothetical protein
MKIRKRNKNGTFAFERGLQNTSEYRSWAAMWDRVSNKNNPDFKNWGGRGITICRRWRNFNNFINDMGKRSNGLTLERIDNNKGYFKNNCRWATRRDQSRNRRFNRWIKFKGENKILSDWARHLGIKISTLSMRLDHYKWSIERSLCA